MKKFLKGFKYAFCGIVYAIKNGVNMKVHLLAVLLVSICGFIFDIGTNYFIVCIILFGIVLSAECFNTSIEILNNMVVRMNKEERYIAAGHSKDVAAGGVLILAISAAICGVIIFIQKIF
ncbi:MAG: diacylglycerol kinase family protein [Bacilli bacterium]|nr:diacylglycerol kinase family protein [Bacilli bacterium]